MSNLMYVTLAAALGLSGCTTLKTGGASRMFGGASEAEAAKAGRYPTEAVLSYPDFIKDCHASALVHTPDGDSFWTTARCAIPATP